MHSNRWTYSQYSSFWAAVSKRTAVAYVDKQHLNFHKRNITSKWSNKIRSMLDKQTEIYVHILHPFNTSNIVDILLEVS